MGFISTKLCIYFYMFKLQSPSKYSPFEEIHPLNHSFPPLKTVLNSSILLPFSASAIFLFHLFHIGKTFPFDKFFHLGKQQQKSRLGLDWMKTEGGAWGSYWMVSMVWAGALINYPSWNGQMSWKSLQKKLIEAKCSLSQQCQLVHYTDGFLEPSPGRGSLYYKGPALQKIILIILGSPSYFDKTSPW